MKVDLPCIAVDVRWVLHLTHVSSVVGELDLSQHNWGIAPHDVPRPIHPLTKPPVWRRVRFVMVVEHLAGEMKKVNILPTQGNLLNHTTLICLQNEAQAVQNVHPLPLPSEDDKKLYCVQSVSPTQSDSLLVQRSHAYILAQTHTHRLLSPGLERPEAPGDGEGGRVDGRGAGERALEPHVCSVHCLDIRWWHVDLYSVDSQHACRCGGIQLNDVTRTLEHSDAHLNIQQGSIIIKGMHVTGCGLQDLLAHTGKKYRFQILLMNDRFSSSSCIKRSSLEVPKLSSLSQNIQPFLPNKYYSLQTREQLCLCFTASFGFMEWMANQPIVHKCLRWSHLLRWEAYRYPKPISKIMRNWMESVMGRSTHTGRGRDILNRFSCLTA